MKSIVIEQVQNGWTAQRWDVHKTWVFETLEELQSELPTLLTDEQEDRTAAELKLRGIKTP